MDTLFNSPQEWLGHMQWDHTVIWACLAAGHEEHRYESQTSLEQHLRLEHEASFSEHQLQELLQKSALPAPDTFGVLTLSISAGSDSRAIPVHGAHQCPLCLKTFPTHTGSDELFTAQGKEIQNHILAHLEAIALMSLPLRDNGESDADSDIRHSDRNQDGDNDSSSLSSFLGSLRSYPEAGLKTERPGRKEGAIEVDDEGP